MHHLHRERVSSLALVFDSQPDVAISLKMTTLAGPLKEVKLSISFNICNVIADVSIAVIMSYLLQDRRKRIAS
jgi:hypothetical protein